MTAILINTINDYRVVVHSTTEHPSSSYGMPVWVDKDNEAYMQVGATTPFYKVIPVDTLDQLASYINDYVQTHDKDWPDGIHEICDLNGWEDLDNGEAHEVARCDNAWGGSRSGAGRKNKGLDLVHRAFRLRREDADTIKQVSEELGISQADVIHELVDNYRQA